MPTKSLNYSSQNNSRPYHMNNHYEKGRNYPTKISPVSEQAKMQLKYNCRFCGKYSARVLHPSNFLLPCKQCHSCSHLNTLKTSYRMLMGTYTCQERRCGFKWVQKLPFKNIILNTPVCSSCHTLTKISDIVYRKMNVHFKNSLLYKCGNCSKSKTISLMRATQNGRDGLKNQSGEKFQNQRKFSFPLNPRCLDCKIPMSFIKTLKSIFSSIDEGEDRPRAKSFSPANRNYSGSHPRRDQPNHYQNSKFRGPRYHPRSYNNSPTQYQAGTKEKNTPALDHLDQSEVSSSH